MHVLTRFCNYYIGPSAMADKPVFVVRHHNRICGSAGPVATLILISEKNLLFAFEMRYYRRILRRCWRTGDLEVSNIRSCRDTRVCIVQ